MVFKPGVTSNTYTLTGSSTSVQVANLGSYLYPGMDTSPYPQIPTMVSISQAVAGAPMACYAVTVNANGTLIHLSGTADQPVFKWDSTTNGAWKSLGSILTNDWLLTDVYNDTYDDYFWQVTQINTVSYGGSFYIIIHDNESSDRQSILVNNSTNATSPKLAVKTFL